GFYKYEDGDVEDKQNRENEIKTAKKALTALAGDKAAEFRMEESDYTGDVQFVRVYEGLDVLGDGAYFFFDGKDNITNYSLRYKKDITFPSKEGVISKKDAIESAFDALGFELGYAIDLENKTALPVFYIGENAEVSNFTMNPFTGKITDYDGEDMKKTGIISYSDIENHYGRDIFLKLAEYGIGFEESTLRPDEPITQADYFVLLNKAFGYYDADIDSLYKEIISNGTISADERADDSALTRENAAIFMVREMGAERYAKHNDMFVPPFDDVTENKGYIAILKAEKVINGDGSGNFHPKNTVTRGEALIMIYNYFTK
ncbi:MAG: S-layer homology domain-containing protein, partial [Clostridia bacterium]|nr:S-layer homology domain-containing protein [Clostridia bacterium]